MTESSTTTWARVSVGLEQGASGFVHAHALTIPGCVASGDDPDRALREFQAVLPEWLTILERIGEHVPSRDQEIEIAVDEWIASDAAVAVGDSDALFEADTAPLTDGEIRRGLALLGELRGRLLPLIRRTPNEGLARGLAGQPDARALLDELARAHWWLLTRLGASPLALVPDRVVSRLDTAMALIIDRLGNLPDASRGQIVELDGEVWTPRKVLRRLLWTEWTLGSAAIRALNHDHTPAE